MDVPGRIEEMGGVGPKKFVEGEQGRGGRFHGSQPRLGSQELPGLSLIFTHSFCHILEFGALCVWIIPSGAQVEYVKTLIKIHETTATENNIP